jgi:hypothetical protein
VTLLPLVLHNQLGHPNNNFLKLAFPSIPFKTINCESCLLSRSLHLPFEGKFPEPDGLLDVICMDLCSLITPPMPLKAKYFLIVIDRKSRF